MMTNSLIALIAMLGGLLQAITGFGGGIIIMMVLPNLVSMQVAPAISGTICTPLAGSIAWRYRKYLNIKKVFFPALVYMAASTVAIRLTTVINMNSMKPVFGGFLVLLSLYFMFFSQKLKVKGTMLTAFVCSAVSGALGGMFGIGGPLMTLYFLAVTETKEEYLGTLNGLFTITSVYQLIVRILSGIITIHVVPAILFGTCGILLGRFFGSKIVDKLDAARMKQYIYLFLAFAGIVTIVGSLDL